MTIFETEVWENNEYIIQHICLELNLREKLLYIYNATNKVYVVLHIPEKSVHAVSDLS
jgi:hypothetical protein